MSKKKASLAEIFAACTGVICAGIAGYEIENGILSNLGTIAAKKSFDIKAKLLEESSFYGEEEAAKEMISFLSQAADSLEGYEDVVLLGPKKGAQGKKTVTQAKLGTVKQLLHHIQDIQDRENEGSGRKVSRMNSANAFNRSSAIYLKKEGMLKRRTVSRKPESTAPVAAL